MSKARDLAERLARGRPERGPTVVASHTVKFRCRVAEIRRDLGLRAIDVARALGINQKSMWRVEHGAGLTLSTALAVADFYGFPVEELWTPIRKK